MFDTVKLRATNVNVDDELLYNNEIVRTSIKLDEATGELKKFIQFKSERIPYLLYSEAGRFLEVQVSIPKFLYGDNVRMVKIDDIDGFFTLLQKEVFTLIGGNNDRKDWKVMRADVCWNFSVGGKVVDYIRQLALLKLPKMTTCTYNQSESVIFYNKSKRIIVYDKERECLVHRSPEDVVENANGVLRLEVQPAVYEMEKYAARRMANDILTKGFFEYVMKKTLAQLSLPPSIEEITYEYVEEHSPKKVEVGLGFKKLLQVLGVSSLKRLHKSSTFDDRMSLVKELGSPSQELPPLEIDFDQLKSVNAETELTER